MVSRLVSRLVLGCVAAGPIPSLGYHSAICPRRSHHIGALRSWGKSCRASATCIHWRALVGLPPGTKGARVGRHNEHCLRLVAKTRSTLRRVWLLGRSGSDHVDGPCEPSSSVLKSPTQVNGSLLKPQFSIAPTSISAWRAGHRLSWSVSTLA
jgi:hypothetical protein